MKINISTVMVDDQEKALQFYTKVLGFVKKTDQSADNYRWLTVVSPDGSECVELLLEATEFPPSKVYQNALFSAGKPITSFVTDDVQKEYDRLTKLGVVFRTKPTNIEWGAYAIFEDTCGNLIHIHQG